MLKWLRKRRSWPKKVARLDGCSVAGEQWCGYRPEVPSTESAVRRDAPDRWMTDEQRARRAEWAARSAAMAMDARARALGDLYCRSPLHASIIGRLDP